MCRNSADRLDEKMLPQTSRDTPPDEHGYIPVYVSRSQYTFEGVGHQRRVISCSTRASHPLIRGNDQSLALSTT